MAIETGVGGWEPTHLEAVGYGAATAATATSAYWAAMTIGRFVIAPLSLRWSAPSILTVCCAGMAGFLLLATVPTLAPYAYFGVGLMIAPIFPTCLPWLNRAVPSVAAAGAYVIAASMIGGVAFPPLLGVVIDTMDVRAAPVVLFVLAAVCAVLGVWLRRNAPDPEAAPGADVATGAGRRPRPRSRPRGRLALRGPSGRGATQEPGMEPREPSTGVRLHRAPAVARVPGRAGAHGRGRR